VHRAGEPWPAEEPDPIAARRAAAADDGVALAAAGMSAGVISPADGVTETSALPATTLLGVEEAAAVESIAPDESEMSEEGRADLDEQGVAAHNEAARELIGSTDADPELTGSTDADPELVGSTDADPELVGSADAHSESTGSADAHLESLDSAGDQADSLAAKSSDPGDDGDERDAPADQSPDAEFHPDADAERPGGDDLRRGSRPLGSAPLLDSEPLPATMPGMLRPRPADGFSLPAQRPAFDIGPEEPADIH
jgi:arginase